MSKTEAFCKAVRINEKAEIIEGEIQIDCPGMAGAASKTEKSPVATIVVVI